MQSLRGVAVVVLTVDREIPGSTPARYCLQIKITAKSWSCGPWLQVSLQLFMLHFTLTFPPTVMGHRTVSQPPIHVCGHRMVSPFLLCRCNYQLDTQVIDYSWTKPWYYHAAQTSSARIQDVDVINISRLYFLESNPGFHGRQSVQLPVRREGTASSLDRLYIKTWCKAFAAYRLWSSLIITGVVPGYK